ncbi:TlpA family protein disulfide reductase [Chitinophagaceae bacterium LB-8]|uniref:TlpA family protein disulfide reductase n=1 Tax=Paraflavisolibacter caeni TaxID=2982496 RepID=A0A9X2XWJ7_9BACT|nr:TlpA disulfide reductase family protein [Paraflavisolibacter caeni]MCU7549972.1 TlpA family protein disulfide reductase [Paraflavisolibacter caeni]
MRFILSVLFLLGSFISLGQKPSFSKPSINLDIDSLFEARKKEAIGKPFPVFKATNETEKINNEILKGKVVLINFWFEGCPPCMAEMDALNELYQRLKNNKDFEFISFTMDQADAIKRVRQKFKLQFKVFHLKDEECNRLNQAFGYPTSIVLDRSGKITYLVSGGATDKDKAREFILTKLLSEITKVL